MKNHSGPLQKGKYFEYPQSRTILRHIILKISTSVALTMNIVTENTQLTG
jgi:hypothetical protein